MCWADRLLTQLPLHLGVASDKRELLVGASRKNLNKKMTHLGAGLPFPAWNTDMMAEFQQPFYYPEQKDGRSLDL